MGSMGDKKINERGNKRERAKEARGRRNQAMGKMEISPENWLYLAAMVEAFMTEDGAIRIGRTRNGGAVAIGVYHGGDYATEYIRPAEDFYEAIGEICEAWLDEGAGKLEHGLRKFQTKLPGA